MRDSGAKAPVAGTPGRSVASRASEATVSGTAAEQELDVLIVCRSGDELVNRGRARALWAASVADAFADLGRRTLLTGRFSDPPLELDQAGAMDAVRRQIANVYGVGRGFLVQVARPPPELNDSDGSWELEHFFPPLLQRARLVYCRDPRLAELCVRHGIPFVYEDHNEDYHVAAGTEQIAALNADGCRLIVAITSAVQDRLVSVGVRAEKVVVKDSGVSASSFESKAEAALRWRRFLRAGRYDHLCVYTGGLQPERGIRQILEAAVRLPKSLFVLAGGKEDHLDGVRRMAEALGADNVRLLGYLDRKIVNEVQQAADVLLLTREDSERKMITSPLKLPEYLASRRPVVSYPLPSLTEREKENLPIFEYSPADGEALAQAIVAAINAQPVAPERYEVGVAFAAQREWSARQQRILELAGLSG